jgi:predicted Rossmann-fold nucleotide-binding protein
VVAPCGIGTVLEAMMIWQLLQVRYLHDTPLLFVGRMWADLVDWAKNHMLCSQPPFANPEDLMIPRCLNTAEEAISMISEHHAKWLQEQKK